VSRINRVIRTWRRALRGTACIVGTVVLLTAILVGVWLLRPNRAQIEEELGMETWDAVTDGAHNSNTDMIFWNDRFYMVYASSPYHFASGNSRLNLLRSVDAREWEWIATFDAAGEDIRDPKLAIIGGRMFLYALKNRELTAEPYQTVYTVSDDAINWSPFREIEPQGWLFWRPKRLEDTWFVPAYWHEHGKSALLRSTDGVNWTIHTVIHEGDRNDETAIEFLPDGRMLATARLEMSDSLFGHPEGCTLIAVAEVPFTDWTSITRSLLTRLDGPNLFSYKGQVYAVGRYQPYPGGPLTKQGSIFSRKRTSLFLVREDGLVRLSDLPSAGDTSYAGVVIRGGDLYICYYTSDTDRDYPWLLGMVLPSSIRMAKVGLPGLETLAMSKSSDLLQN
jgi:hypothetical protein